MESGIKRRGITLTCFLVQVATGFAMTFYYRPTVTEAFASVQYIMTEANFGWLIRSVHRWSASMMVLMMILHVFRVYLTGGFKKPRELTWVTGVILGVLTASFGVTGYSLPRDQIVQVATGFAMTFYYRPTVTEAFASVQYIMTEANFGWLIRSVHRWSASMMVLMMILHVFRVYLTGGFKKPRELTWVTGVILGVLTASFGVTGYSLPRDQIGYWAVKIVTGVPDAIPGGLRLLVF
ncbi:hypothetical protein C5167_006517 [Papaver somniferum]|uniref:Cytochrome b/b6 N-terminal region profile domain-containing protein n=1 Tax=Papaver somniferum TaxID=3469 RepID=A0A4Y7JDN6_PAPSO|nr:hypothetical protein C5167_006517 [Papaver somniferum]